MRVGCSGGRTFGRFATLLPRAYEDERQRLLRLLLESVTIKGKSIRIELAVYRLRPTRPPPSPRPSS